MIKGIGIDTVDIYEMENYIQDFDSFITHTFTKKEIELSNNKPNKAEYYASRFAVKEAVFKALAHLTTKKSFDFRLVETLIHEDGAPYVHITDGLSEIMKEANVTNIFLSLTHETQYATAFVIVSDD